MDERAKQDGLDFEPQYDHHDGMNFTFSAGSGLMIPAPGESERIAKERGPEMLQVVGSKPVLFAVESQSFNRGATVDKRSRSVERTPSS